MTTPTETPARTETPVFGWPDVDIQRADPQQPDAPEAGELLSVLHLKRSPVTRPRQPDPPAMGPQPLTGREREVLALVAEGNSNKVIGGRLLISERTVKSHLTYIMTKLRASDRTHAVVTAVRLGWLAI